MKLKNDLSISRRTAAVEKYYRYHSFIYDVTRWSFLFGRNTILEMIPKLPANPRILEIGCGTAHNLVRLQDRFPDAQITGIDLSAHMLEVAESKVGQFDSIELHRARYGADMPDLEPFDLILCSYSLTMFDAEMRNIIPMLSDNLKTGGYIAVVDFHTSPFNWFCKWMNRNHVHLNTPLLPLLNKHYSPLSFRKKKAFGGLWSYFMFVGQWS